MGSFKNRNCSAFFYLTHFSYTDFLGLEICICLNQHFDEKSFNIPCKVEFILFSAASLISHTQMSILTLNTSVFVLFANQPHHYILLVGFLTYSFLVLVFSLVIFILHQSSPWMFTKEQQEAWLHLLLSFAVLFLKYRDITCKIIFFSTKLAKLEW